MNTTQGAFTKPEGRRRKITSTLLALSLSVGMIVGTATPAHAATSVKGCFVYQGGGSGLWGMPVALWATWDGITWYSVGGVRTTQLDGTAWVTCTGVCY